MLHSEWLIEYDQYKKLFCLFRKPNDKHFKHFPEIDWNWVGDFHRQELAITAMEKVIELEKDDKITTLRDRWEYNKDGEEVVVSNWVSKGIPR